MSDPLFRSAPDAPGRIVRAWWRVMGWRIGVIPAPVAVVIAAVVAVFLQGGGIPSDLLTSIAVLSVGGFACAEVGRRLPFLGAMGAAAICATFVPSYLVHAGLLPAPLVSSITTFTRSSNFLYLFISAIIVGSILGMDRRMLMGGFVRIFAPLAAGSVVATAVGCAVGLAVGFDLRHTLFRIIAPIMAGGVGEGALPLSMGYAAITHQPQGGVFAEILPVVMFASLTAILLSGGLNLLGRAIPSLTGQGQLERDVRTSAPKGPAGDRPAVEAVAGAVVMAVTFYLCGVVAQRLTGFPAPVAMLALAVSLKLARAIPPDLEQGAFAVYQFFRVAVTYPLLFAIGVAMTPWEKLVSAFNAPTLVTIVATVSSLMATGFVVARWVGLHPIEAAIVNACHSGQGGTGDVAILSAADRMQLMPFAQIATRIGGAITVTLALVAARQFGI